MEGNNTGGAGRVIGRAFRRAWLYHSRKIIIGATLLIFASTMGILALFEAPKSFFSEVLASSIAVVFVTFVIERPVVAHFQTLNTFRVRRFCREISLAEEHVEILDIWMKRSFLDLRIELFRAALLDAICHGVKVRILVSDPNSAGAKARAKELSQHAIEFVAGGPEAVEELMHDGIDMLKNLNEAVMQRLKQRKLLGYADNFQIKMCKETPKLSMYRCDNSAYWSHYLQNKLSTDGLQYKTNTQDGPAEYLGQHFLELWAHAETYDLSEYRKQ